MTDSVNSGSSADVLPDCPFCIEIADVEASEFRSLFPSDELASRIVAEDSEFSLIAGIGAFRPGYLLLIPKVHVQSFSRLSAAHASRADAWLRLSVANLRRHFGNVIAFEHGGVGTNTAGGCIDHAHIHLVSSGADLMSEMNRRMSYAPVADIAGLRTVASNRPYVLVHQGDDMRAYFPQERLPSQYLRRLLLELEGQPDVWDWAVFPGKEHMLTTMRVVSADASANWTPNV